MDAESPGGFVVAQWMETMVNRCRTAPSATDRLIDGLGRAHYGAPNKWAVVAYRRGPEDHEEAYGELLYVVYC